MPTDHLRNIDPATWPGIATVPSGSTVTIGARVAEAGFARVVDKTGISLDGEQPELVIHHEALFARLARSGWLGLGESYLAGEWEAEDLAGVLAKLIGADYRPGPRRRSALAPVSPGSGELPVEVLVHSGGEGTGLISGRFDSGVSTTVTEAVPGSDKNRPRFVDITRVTAPVAVEVSDLADAQNRSITEILNSTEVGPGSRVLELGGTGGAVAVLASRRRAEVEVVVSDEAFATATAERIVFDGAGGRVHTQVIPDSVPKTWLGRHDAVIAMERLEQLPPKEHVEFLRLCDKSLVSGGHLGLQSIVRTEEFTPCAERSLDLLRAYIWPGLRHPSVHDIHNVVHRSTRLTVLSETHTPEHLAETLALQREVFASRYREAAADGIDQVFRRLWHYQFCLREALARLGMLDCVQVIARSRAL